MINACLHLRNKFPTKAEVNSNHLYSNLTLINFTDSQPMLFA
jgi:hypothetical protein